MSFRTIVKKKNRSKEESKTLEEIYENHISKIIEEEGTKKVRMLLPTKTRNGVLEKRLVEESNDRSR